MKKLLWMMPRGEQKAIAQAAAIAIESYKIKNRQDYLKLAATEAISDSMILGALNPLA
ncbi:MAG: hypothetical protein N3E45_15000 [Oscillatoriaceae bacterium SKW80]|nr:hypothetical protein [Oscillatoriaceae bacterium SKYG93]MCX8122105.1 hypothetical protein [Oscillatoriaceae bacterium SKW80]MDW8454392.1 hypothetical protein [Oscillatoriaceae cyanobacterium SKYGB_i_bin93]